MIKMWRYKVLYILILFVFCGCDATTLSIINGALLGLTNSGKFSAGTRPEYRSVNSTVYDWNNFFFLEGTIIIANDGQPLGIITKNRFSSDSLINEFGTYGNKFSSKSIFNKLGQYGSEISGLSPFNVLTSTPPKIYDRNGKFIAYFTCNELKRPRVDPILLIADRKSVV